MSLHALSFHNLLHRPQRLLLRRLLFQVHLWTGVGVGLYIFVVAVTGSLLVFRGEVEARLRPELLHPAEAGASQVSIPAVVDTVRAAHPEARLLGVYAPAGERQTFIVWLSEHGATEPIFVDPTTGTILGTRPENSWIAWLQDLHFYLLGGDTGSTVNGFGALSLLALGLTGLVIWWPGVHSWRRALTFSFGTPWKRFNRDFHTAAGFWCSALIVVWAASGVYFAFPAQFRAVVDRLSPLTVTAPPLSKPGQTAGHEADLASLISAARAAVPGAPVVRVSFPDTETDAVEIVLAPDGAREANEIGYVSLYFDRHDGELLEQRRHVVASAGDAVMAWIGAIHTGSFGGLLVKVLWATLGLVPALLFVTGALMWWNRVVSKKLKRLTSSSHRRIAPHFRAGPEAPPDPFSTTALGLRDSRDSDR